MSLGVDLVEFYNGYLPDSETLLYNVPQNRKALIKSIVLRNVDTAVDYTIDLVLYANAVTFSRISPSEILAEHTTILDVPIVCDPGTEIRGQAGTASKVTCVISGIEEDLTIT